MNTKETTIVTGAENVRYAEARIRPYIRETPIEHGITPEGGLGSVWLKFEHHQFSGSFKARGMLNKLLTLSDAERSGGIVTASTGNHGLAAAYAAEKTGVHGTVFVPYSADSSKRRAMDRFNVEVRPFGHDMSATEGYAVDAAEKSGRKFISQYEDPEIISGNGTVALELMRQISEVDVVFACVGSGSLVGGVGSYLKAVQPNIKIVAASPANCPVLFDKVMGTGREFQELSQTISDACVNSVNDSSITIDIARAVVDEWILVEEKEIKNAMALLFEEYRQVVEGAGALTVAAYLKEREKYKDSNCVLIIGGSNVDMTTFRQIIR